MRDKSATPTAQFVRSRVYHVCEHVTNGRRLGLRNNGYTICSQRIDTVLVVLLLCLTGAIGWERFWGLVENGFLFKVLVALADTPVLYLAVGLLRRALGLAPGEEISGEQPLA